MNRAALDLWVGFFVVIGFAALLFLAMKVGNFYGFSNHMVYSVEAPFDNIGGLKVHAPVKSAGVLVGRVASVRFDTHSYQAIVQLDIDNRYPFPNDTIAMVLTSGLLGEQYIGLEAGVDDVMLKNGDRLTMTQSAVVLEKLIGQFLFNQAAEPPTPAKSAPANNIR